MSSRIARSAALPREWQRTYVSAVLERARLALLDARTAGRYAAAYGLTLTRSCTAQHAGRASTVPPLSTHQLSLTLSRPPNPTPNPNPKHLREAQERLVRHLRQSALHARIAGRHAVVSGVTVTRSCTARRAGRASTVPPPTVWHMLPAASLCNAGPPVHSDPSLFDTTAHTPFSAVKCRSKDARHALTHARHARTHARTHAVARAAHANRATRSRRSNSARACPVRRTSFVPPHA